MDGFWRMVCMRFLRMSFQSRILPVAWFWNMLAILWASRNTNWTSARKEMWATPRRLKWACVWLTRKPASWKSRKFSWVIFPWWRKTALSSSTAPSAWWWASWCALPALTSAPRWIWTALSFLAPLWFLTAARGWSLKATLAVACLCVLIGCANFRLLF